MRTTTERRLTKEDCMIIALFILILVSATTVTSEEGTCPSGTGWDRNQGRCLPCACCIRTYFIGINENETRIAPENADCVSQATDGDKKCLYDPGALATECPVQATG
ncbi:uncharacterized protein LOC106175950 isoform X2 [Lingula anatina]|uniref:Uncharacterized protein LOC106175950 isoform X2 n=1 Tax=Lingula anatina TaxID=7574 RepID=A0A1S3JU43_LINAN|nr:uncharacterized protein LOC106175950 isoform X2 [Lingula anatina]|eukprot:XP_013413604.1 uncharacterized protein LOC106175950 isoform X2 [Lingula anatina]